MSKELAAWKVMQPATGKKKCYLPCDFDDSGVLKRSWFSRKLYIHHPWLQIAPPISQLQLLSVENFDWTSHSVRLVSWTFYFHVSARTWGSLLKKKTLERTHHQRFEICFVDFPYPLCTWFYRPKATNLRNLMRLWVYNSEELFVAISSRIGPGVEVVFHHNNVFFSGFQGALQQEFSFPKWPYST